MFLENSESADFLTPVAGPNGMVQIFNGEVNRPNKEAKTFFEDFLKSKTSEETSIQEQNENSYMVLYIILGVLVSIMISVLIYRLIRKR